MERPLESQDPSLLEEPLRRFLENDPTLRVSRVAHMLESTSVDFDENTSVSITHRGDEDVANKITIGTVPLSENTSSRWNMGTSDKSEQILIKLSHELAHAFQTEKGYEGALVKFLNGGSNDIPENMIPYIELYALLSQIGAINPLTKEFVYAKQSRSTGNIKIETFEDITELISAYIISDEYFLYRLENSVTNLSHEEKEEVAKKVIEICRELH